MRTIILVFAVASFAAVIGVRAEECAVENFTVKDFERLNFSEALTLSVIDVMESANESRSA